MKKTASLLLAGFLALSLAGCGGGNGPDVGADVNASDYETASTFITLADLPPNPLSMDDIQTYAELGLNTMILTEDSVPFIRNGTLSDEYKKAIRNIGNGGLDVWIRNMHNDADYFQNDDPDKVRLNYGTPYRLEACNITTEFDEFPEVTGYYMSDEPFMISDLPMEWYGAQYASLDQYQKLIDWKNQYAPDAYFHMNMVPSSSYDHFKYRADSPKAHLTANNTYRDFIQYYVDNIVAEVESGGRSVCLDNYPFTSSAPNEVAQSFLIDILTAAVVTRDYNETALDGREATFGICVQTFENTNPLANLRYPASPEEITFQMYTGMACGARLFEYFCYRTFAAGQMYGILDESGKPSEEYYIVQEANNRAFEFQKVVCGFDWYNLVPSPASNITQVENSATYNGIKDLVEEDAGVLTSVTSQYDAIVGCFKQGKTDGYMIVNYSAPVNNRTNTIRLKFDGCSKAIVWTTSGAKTVKLLNGEARLTVKAGDAAFVVPVK